MVNASDVLLVAKVARTSDGLTSVLQQHLDDYDCLLPHLYMADVASWALAEYVANPTSAQLALLIGSLEEMFAVGHEADRELIAVSFSENLPFAAERGYGLVGLL